MMKINQLLLATRHPAAVPLPIEGEMPSLGGATAWLNAPPLSAAGLRGRVVLIDFWTYTCINWLRTLPYLRAWAEKYRSMAWW
jgi:thiol-disulfide isomerase/thioredoxin